MYRCHITVAWLLGKCFLTDSSVRHGQDWKYHFLISSIYVDGIGLNADAWGYFIRSGKFDVWQKLLDCLVGSKCKSCLLDRFCGSGGTKFLFGGLSVLVGYCTLPCYVDTLFVKTASNPASHIFPIEIREMCDNPGRKCTSLPSAVNCGIASVHTVVDGSWLPHVDETYIMCPQLCAFLWG